MAIRHDVSSAPRTPRSSPGSAIGSWAAVLALAVFAFAVEVQALQPVWLHGAGQVTPFTR